MSTLRRVAMACANCGRGLLGSILGRNKAVASDPKGSDLAADPGDAPQLLVNGLPNPVKYGRPLRKSKGHPPSAENIREAAVRLGRPALYVDQDGYEREIIGAAISQGSGAVGYVEARAKEVGNAVDITIKIHIQDADGNHKSIDIESYNPFFGCDVRLFEWIGTSAVLIYREKHWTFVCRFGDSWPPRFIKIENDWTLKDSVLSYVGYKQDIVQRLRVPSLAVLESIPVVQAKQAGLFLDH